MNNPRAIIFWVISRYMSNEAIELFKENIVKVSLVQDRKFVSEIEKVFDLSILVNKPIIPEDAWIYHYINDAKGKAFKRKGLILKYEKAVIKPIEMDYLKFVSLFNL